MRKNRPKPFADRSRSAGAPGAVSPNRSRNQDRPPVAAGLFYPEKKRVLTDRVDRLTAGRAGTLLSGEEVPPSGGFESRPVVAVIAPHSSYAGSSGWVAGALYARIRRPACVVVVGPDHSGSLGGVSVGGKEPWRTPLGTVPVHWKLAAKLQSGFSDFKQSKLLHLEEHSIEVQLPFLQRQRGIFRLVPVLVGSADPELVRAVGEGIARSVRSAGEAVLLAASTNLSGYAPESVIRAQDKRTIRRLIELDVEGLLDSVRKGESSLCGAGAAAAVMTAARRLGAGPGTLVAYRTRAELTGDVESSVGFGGLFYGESK